jgi:preprotein translocase subunit SecG
MQALVAIVLLVASAVFGFLAVRGRGTAELWGTLATIALMTDTFVVQRARVLTIPFFFVLCIILLFWSARRSAERQDAEPR